jgi:hypothetical protein
MRLGFGCGKSDPNYGSFFSVAPFDIGVHATSNIEQVGIAKLVDTAQRYAAYLDDLRLIDGSLRRFAGAVDDSNLLDAETQREHVVALASEAEADRLSVAESLREYASLIRNTTSDFAASSTDLRSLQAQISRDGLPPLEAELLVSNGLTSFSQDIIN